MEQNAMNCVCKEMPKLPEYPVVAMAYVPELDKKFYGGKCCG